jgi:hypothetical protein
MGCLLKKHTHPPLDLVGEVSLDDTNMTFYPFLENLFYGLPTAGNRNKVGVIKLAARYVKLCLVNTPTGQDMGVCSEILSGVF